jgi:hypothetical protein
MRRGTPNRRPLAPERILEKNVLSCFYCGIAERCDEGSQGIYPLEQFALDSSPQIPLVVIDAMPVEKGPILLLESLPAMMFPLLFDKPNHILQLGFAHGEGSVTILPSECTSVKRFVEPQAGPALH